MENSEPHQTDPKVKIVIVDDDPLMLAVIARILQRAAFETLAVQTASEGKAAIESHSPDVVISDIFLNEADGDGYDLIAWIRARRPSLPIIAMSGGDLRGDAQFSRASGLGATALLEKPVRAAAVIEAVNRVLQQRPS